MSRLYALGEAVRVSGFALAGATVLVADDPDAVRRAWASLPDDAVVVLTSRAARAITGSDVPTYGRLTAVMPP